MKVRINAGTLICKHVDIKANIQYITERKKIKMIQNLKCKKEFRRLSTFSREFSTKCTLLNKSREKILVFLCPKS